MPLEAGSFSPGLQPLVHRETLTLRAPTQVWSSSDGSIGTAPIHGIYHADRRLVSAMRLEVDGRQLEFASGASLGADRLRAVGLLRHIDPGVDSTLRAIFDREVATTSAEDRLLFESRRREPTELTVTVTIVPDSTRIDIVKAGGRSNSVPSPKLSGDQVTWETDDTETTLAASGAEMTVADDVTLTWKLTVPPGGAASVSWRFSFEDRRPAVTGVEGPVPWSIPTVTAPDARLARWVEASLSDLDALRLTTPSDPDAVFVGAGAPWYLTLFGRDSLWAARMLLPLGTGLARGTLHTLGERQGSDHDIDRAEQPGKILHELRREEVHGEDGMRLPPLYYGTVDATPLWIILLADAWRWGLSDDEVIQFLPRLEAALRWVREHGDADGDGLLEYIDESGHGLSNQGWKDSGDSVQWHDGRFADVPIALAEVQGYAYEAAISGAEILDYFGRPGGDDLRDWAERLRHRFHETFWVEDADGPFPAIALDADKRPVDSLTSNIGHLLGTGILDREQAGLVARRLISPEMSSGYGLRTLSTRAAGYWPLSYHGGSVWTHDTAIAIDGLVTEGYLSEATVLIEGLLAAAEGFGYRMPELHSGDPRDEIGRPIPYPAACRPQAWSAASAILVMSAVFGLHPRPDGLHVDPGPKALGATVSGIRFRGEEISISVAPDGTVTSNSPNVKTARTPSG
jgi:glycogen debranching enzyme